MEKTKIICSVGPSCADSTTLQKMIEAGMDFARFNMSHGTYQSHKDIYKNVVKASKKAKKQVGIILDTKGPEIRIKDFEKGKIVLKEKQKFTLTTREILGNEKEVSVTLSNLPQILKKDDIVFVNDGEIKLKVKKTTNTDVETIVVVGGELSNKKGVNIPGIETGLKFLSEQDKKDIAFAKEIYADYVALSFVGCAQDVLDTKEYLKSLGLENVKIISKIENLCAIENFDKILKVSDGIMVARGDLGVEIDYVKIPYLQKQFIKKCNRAKKFVIVATQMMETMTHNPKPTRAEISDVANAVFDGADAVMLSGETSAGEYPVKTVEEMRRIADDAEAHK